MPVVEDIKPTQYNFELDGEDYFLSVTDNLDVLKAAWYNGNNLFLGYKYLKALSLALPRRSGMVLMVLRRNDKIIGHAVFQTVILKGKDDFKPDEHLNADENKNVLRCIFDQLKGVLIKKSSVNILVVGNMMNVGTNFFNFSTEINDIDQFKLLGKMVKRSIQYLKDQHKLTFHTSLFKEIPDHEKSLIEVFKMYRYFPFEVEPNMVVNIKWETPEDYLQSMSSKYRVRCKRARKKFYGLVKREMTLQEITKYKTEMESLYKLIANQAQFNMVSLNPNYHIEMKAQLEDQYKVIGYWDNDTLVGFFTLLVEDDKVDAGYLGLKSEYNPSHQLYLNMLYDMVEWSINNRVDKLILARTALEIKSSVGAEPERMVLFLRNQKPIIHEISTRILKVLNNPTQWTQRKPFKV